MGKVVGVTGIGTDVGKTVVSGILAQALQADYWKPVQAGDLNYSDSHKIEERTQGVRILPERYRLTSPMSPHAAAEIDGIEISLEDFGIPDFKEYLIIEGAGGIMVPMNKMGQHFGDLFHHLKVPVIVVSRHYLGSINHTLLTLNFLKQIGVEVLGLIFVGDENKTTESIITSSFDIPWVHRVPLASEVNKEFTLMEAEKIKDQLISILNQ